MAKDKKQGHNANDEYPREAFGGKRPAGQRTAVEKKDDEFMDRLSKRKGFFDHI